LHLCAGNLHHGGNVATEATAPVVVQLLAALR
jgi:hypothetical protein